MRRQRTLVGLLAAVVAAVAGWWLGSTTAEESPPAPAAATVTVTVTVTPEQGSPPVPSGNDPESGLRWIAPDNLPPEARETLALIEAGGPFPYDRDGVVFQNRERILPGERRGYYREYTVPTPGSDDRGARRIVAGADGELYYTDDHYDSFRRITP